ncbi:MAG TPA: class I SAM-dependent methyltransferase [Candidatus Limnocylindrales bacterium]|nr:class I SAM-dependent methyltransferase [Candidatus Limnocylindrales bacterium]
MNESTKTISALRTVQRLGPGPLRAMRKARQQGWEALISPHFMTRVIQTLYRVGFFDAIAKQNKVNAETFASEHNLDLPLLIGLCDALYERKFLAKDGSSYSIAPHGQFLLETDLVRGWFELAYGYENVLNQMEPLLRKEVVYGKDLVREGRAVAVGSGLASMGFYFPLVADIVKRAGYRRVLDIGCGDGTFLRDLCARIPSLECVGVDLSPAAVEAGNEQLAVTGLDRRIRLYAGDAMEIGKLKNELKGVDSAATFFVLHELCHQKENPRAAQFLSAFRETLPGVPFHIVETIRPTPREMFERPGPAVEYFLFHDLSLQKPIGRAEWKQLFRRVGFDQMEEEYITFARTSIFTVR